MKRYLLVAVACCFLGLEPIAPVDAGHAKTQRITRVSEAWPVSDFALIDQHGKAFTDKQVHGRWTFILLGDTRCAEPCKTALTALTGMYQRIATANAIKTTQVLFVSLDPERDSPALLQKFMEPFDKRFVGVTGSRQTLKRLVDDLSMSVRVAAAPGAGDVSKNSYSGSLLLMGPDGMVRSELLPPFDVLLLTAEYLKTRARG
jgi:protein SCO1